MISMKSIFVVTIKIFLISQVAAYKGWGDPACSEASNIQGSDCLCALGQFFESSNVYTSVKNFTASEPQSYGSCTVVLRTSTENCSVGQEYLRSGKSPALEKLKGNRGGMDYLITKCIDHQTSGEVQIFEDPQFTRPTPLSCNWNIIISENK
ncbi:secreted protein [Melampsora americana]|nr:secreted protein [Melampsora americana]